jgi:hypothetical protein
VQSTTNYKIKLQTMEWVFDGVGTAIISLIAGLLTGGAVGYKIGINNNSAKQKQKAGKNSSQIQIGRDYNDK